MLEWLASYQTDRIQTVNIWNDSWPVLSRMYAVLHGFEFEPILFILDTKPLGALYSPMVWPSDSVFIFRLRLGLFPLSSKRSVATHDKCNTMHRCIWMRSTKFEINLIKTELMWSETSRHQRHINTSDITIASTDNMFIDCVNLHEVNMDRLWVWRRKLAEQWAPGSSFFGRWRLNAEIWC